MKLDQKTLKECRIYQMLAKSKQHISFHTPGHKVGKWDITELSFSDNLSAPTGVLAEAEKDIAEELGAARSFISTDGSTMGVFAMIYASGACKLLIPKNSHKSVYNACYIMGKRTVVVNNDVLDGIPQPLSPDRISSHLEGVEAVLITYPDYYGNLSDLWAIKNLCEKKGIPLLVDGAHGSAFKGSELHASRFADMWVDGVHKGLPCLTQGAVVSANEKYAEALAEGVDIFRTTSPNYLLMASVEYAVKSRANEKIERAIIKFKEKTGAYQNGDWTKAVYSFGKNAFAAQKYLEKKGIYPEFCDGDNIMFYFSRETKKSELKKLKRVLYRAKKKFPPSLRLTPENVQGRKGLEIEEVPLEGSEGRICAVACGLFPPCTPLVASGERVTADSVEKLMQAENFFGLTVRTDEDGESVRCIQVFKD